MSTQQIQRHILILLLACCLLLFTSCKSYKQVQVVRAPKPQIIANGHEAKIMPARFLKLRITKQLSELEELIINDKNYVYITKEWFLAMDKWTDKYILNQVPDLYSTGELPVDYRETYIMFLSSIANLQIALHYNVKSSALIGIIVAESVELWGEIAPTGRNEIYAIVLTEEQMLVYDIITKQLCKIHDFPNLKHTKAIIF